MVDLHRTFVVIITAKHIRENKYSLPQMAVFTFYPKARYTWAKFSFAKQLKTTTKYETVTVLGVTVSPAITLIDLGIYLHVLINSLPDSAVSDVCVYMYN